MEASIALPGHFTKIGQEPLDNWNLHLGRPDLAPALAPHRSPDLSRHHS
jgi:hypothetical protein